MPTLLPTLLLLVLSASARRARERTASNLPVSPTLLAVALLSSAQLIVERMCRLARDKGAGTGSDHERKKPVLLRKYGAH
jgi:hypothetical protein